MGLLKLNNNAVIFGEANWNDTMIPPTTQRTGTIAPNLTTGFRGDANFQQLQFISSQADEVQFIVQMPHSWKTGTAIYPHVHFSPTVNIADGTYNVQFIMEYFWANINAQFPTPASSYTMTKQFTVTSNDHIWKHFMATNGTPITNASGGISSILVVRLYRDNTVGSNYGQPVAMLGFDIHFNQDGIGSDEHSSKAF